MRRHRRRRTVTFLFLVAAVLVGATLSTRWLMMQLYPLNHRDLVFAHSRRNGLDPHLVAALIRVESRWDPQAVSRTGALGLMQVMPPTAAWAAERMGFADYRPEQLTDPAVNIRIGTWYLAYLLGAFNGNELLALAAYNGGDGNVRQWLADGRWNGELHRIDQIPFPETRRFVARVLHDLRYYRRLYPTAGAEP